MAELLSPGEARAEAYRQKVQKLGGSAMSTQELLEAADAISKVAGQVISADKKFIKKAGQELGKKVEESG